MSETYQLESLDLEEKQQKMLEAAQRVWKRDQEMMAKRREIARRFEQLKAAWQEGGVAKMSEVYEEMARNPVQLDPKGGE
jgi:altronate dehydratase